MRITELQTLDLRFPTSLSLDGSDAMNPDPDYSAAYVILKTDVGLEGHGLTFTIGRGNDLVCAAIHLLEPQVVGHSLAEFTGDMGGFYRYITGDSQLRWLGPEKGVIHLATAAVINAVWDLWARSQGKPLWKLVVDMTPEELVRCVDFRYLTDALTPEEALEHLRRMAPGKPEREARLLREGYPAYTTSVGWLGYPDEKIRCLCREALEQGFTAFKLKVGRNLEDDLRRCRIVREEIGWERHLMVDANQVWDVPQALEWVRQLLPFRPLWVEEPTSPDDILGHLALQKALQGSGTQVATGEHVQNRVVFKQLLQSGAIGFCQIDAARVGGVNENLAILLMAAKFGVPVCPHAGGVGLCEYVQHLSAIDYIAISGSLENRYLEYVDHLHEHFVEPVVLEGARYRLPQRPGYSVEIWPASREEYRFPDGVYWRGRLGG
ncbi:MAG: L-fuconate dehydratase [Meiothermus sp.]|uniref:L-fuconate dehydratase n=1 Tax=Meiothermus sp. TaxID=1955249 RepID=UPI0025EE88F3|nr:L-fuconate dehydratase [Meiothermus sp.]MCS7057496.1 L-fuconate dehydratase [Meiothermus sp.]MCS7195044.1 L-fuconate dehydratase [Meiothermus sp.]MCX7739582.1 L-fuconate dehydratase [Meiothermus sp.]MDW8090848.1 L-fuconate dehydratase [Meiothermus sp.]MDW8482457.1 L-fuconate dehydratase [Meiothermus sp.]